MICGCGRKPSSPMEELGVGTPEGLEIVSIGTLYRGPWDKKYWSCSRGKDRYPYPVGYHAQRTNAGITYKMEIREGNKGPLFVVTSDAGDSSSGQTPDMAWEYFQKKSGPRVRNCHGKRFSCKIDGIELFGFRNPFIQRLLRELMANIHGVAEQSLMYSNDHGGSSPLRHLSEGTESDVRIDLLMLLQKQHGTRKRSRKHVSAIKDAATAGYVKRIQMQNLVSARGVCISEEDGSPCLDMEPLKDLTGHFENPGEHEPAKNVIATGFDSVSYIGSMDVQPRQSDSFSEEMEIELHIMNSRKIDRSLDFDLKMTKLVVDVQERNCKDANGATNAKDFDLYIPDSLDITQGNATFMSYENEKENHLNGPDDPVTDQIAEGRPSCKHEASNQDVLEELIKGTEAHANILDSRTSVIQMETHDNDCLPNVVSSHGFVEESLSTDLGRQAVCRNIRTSIAGEDLARSMMTLLLPHAVPLLTKTYQRKRGQKLCQVTSSASDLYSNGSVPIPGDDLTYKPNVEGKGFESPPELNEWRLKEAGSSVGTNLLCQEIKECTYNDLPMESIVMSEKLSKFIIPDSLEDEQLVSVVPVQRLSCAYDEADEAPFEYRNNYPEVVQRSGDNNADLKQCCKCDHSEVCAMNVSFSSSTHEGETSLNISPSACLTPGKNTMLGKADDPCLNMDESFLHPLDIHRNARPLDAEITEVGLHLNVSDTTNPKTNGTSSTKVETYTNFNDCAWKCQSIDYDEVFCIAEDPLLLKDSADLLPLNGEATDMSGTTRKLQFSPHSPCKLKIPLSESIICRNTTGAQVPEKHSGQSLNVILESDRQAEKDHVNDNASHYGQKEQHLSGRSSISRTVGTLSSSSLLTSQNQEIPKDLCYFSDLSGSSECCDHIPVFDELAKSSDGTNHEIYLAFTNENHQARLIDNKHSDHCHTELDECPLHASSLSKNLIPEEEFGGFVELIGCYLHPKPVISILISSKDNALNVCVLCGHMEESDREIFIYKVYPKLHTTSPSFTGYTTLSFPIIRDACNQGILVERVALQFTPDGQSLALLNSIKSPCCREKNVHCHCSLCLSECHEENAIKIVHVELGYTTTVTKLRTSGKIYCILVCAPVFLLAIEETGELHVWIMNSLWRNCVEEFSLPSFDYMPTSVIELQQVPIHGHLVIGHNAVGKFCLWDISKRVLLAKFSAACDTILQALPIGSIQFPDDASATFSRPHDHDREVLSSTDFVNFQDSSNFGSSLHSVGDTAIWLLVFSSSLEAQNENLMIETDTTSVGWRLALLAKGMILMGSLLDPRASSLSVLGDYGITGTTDGCVYIWELLTGSKLVNLHSFDGERISCIATNAESGAFAVAGDKCHLRIYIKSKTLPNGP